MNETWAFEAVRWLLTPALVTAILIALAQFYNPPTRWTRRIKNDMSIAGGLPDGLEKERWQSSITSQAARLRLYRRAFVGWPLFLKWAGIVYIGISLGGLILWPPLNKPDEPVAFGPADYIFLGQGVLITLFVAITVSSGRSTSGRTPPEIIVRQRVRDHDRRLKKLKRIEKVRASRAATDSSIRPKGSRLGFSTQVDELGAWVRDPGLRALTFYTPIAGSDLAAETRRELAERGIRIPDYPR
ncbi:hypothetical protein [Microbacterium oleivorans]|uniref:Uncharacterized protein n=1 Tax=Microbacterium oleivorans TaxID=273677 RepID=A0A031FNV8_9MICO|nr:hypothetical protein [Microbacterium oleivorans]EZP26248.1 hypothetical protein BW34_02580 [Microbacterium oleivorans]